MPACPARAQSDGLLAESIPALDNFSAPFRLAENASTRAAMAGSDQASPGRRHDISINSISAATARRAKVRNSGATVR